MQVNKVKKFRMKMNLLRIQMMKNINNLIFIISQIHLFRKMTKFKYF
jgi:hypothetical protein